MTPERTSKTDQTKVFELFPVGKLAGAGGGGARIGVAG